MNLSVHFDSLPVHHSPNTESLITSFGLGDDHRQHTIADNLQLNLTPEKIALFLGPSGSGKSSLLREVTRRLASKNGQTIININDLVTPNCSLIDALALPMGEALNVLSSCGLSEPRALLHTPNQLSDGQRYRFRMALAFAEFRQRNPNDARWLIADEFTSGLDRPLAKVLSYNLQRLARKSHIGLLLASVHEDVMESLRPNVLIRCDHNIPVQIENHPSEVENPGPPSFFRRSPSVRAPAPTGRTFLGGITAARI